MKLLVTLIFSTLILFASDNSNHIETQILEKVLSKISINKEIRIYSDNKRILSELKDHASFITTESYKDATLLILENESVPKKACMLKAVFVLKYDLLTAIPQSFGALFWKKGRPNIVIIEPRIESQNIIITKDLEPYLEEKIW